MKQTTASWLLPVALLIAQPTWADFTTTFYDPCTGDIDCNVTTAPPGTQPLYHGGGTVGGAPYVGDTVGGVGDFDILSMTVSTSGTYLNVSIVTRFVQDPWNYPNIGYGDLLISTTGWHPNGAAPYDTDTATTSGTQWNYVVQTTGVDAGRIFSVTGDNLLRTEQLDQDTLFKNDQYVKYGSGGSLAGTATVAINDQYEIPDAVDGTSTVYGTQLDYEIPLAALGLPVSGGTEVALRWAMTCANDIVEAAVNVPEPSSLALFLGGLAGLRLLRRPQRAAKAALPG